MRKAISPAALAGAVLITIIVTTTDPAKPFPLVVFRIVFLSSLDFFDPLEQRQQDAQDEEIRRMQAGGTVADGMRRHLVTLERERRSLEQSIQLCSGLKDHLPQGGRSSVFLLFIQINFSGEEYHPQGEQGDCPLRGGNREKGVGQNRRHIHQGVDQDRRGEPIPLRLMAGAFEECGRWLALKSALRWSRGPEDALMYGAGPLKGRPEVEARRSSGHTLDCRHACLRDGPHEVLHSCQPAPVQRQGDDNVVQHGQIYLDEKQKNA